MPIDDVSKNITEDRIFEVTRLIDHTLRRAGVASPRIAMASLN
ncbi:MAG: 4-hydroxythreonine-4-phosphate dehydrogenase PdxA, partial [Leptolyngbya sp. SIO4C5]|nr:4-hydroxythreonine-4-phosphate dehydrogenase PdxA [Leptolyngbya sp. SIO4C5]